MISLEITERSVDEMVATVKKIRTAAVEIGRREVCKDLADFSLMVLSDHPEWSKEQTLWELGRRLREWVDGVRP